MASLVNLYIHSKRLCARIRGYNIYTTNRVIYEQIKDSTCFKCGRPLYVNQHKMITFNDPEPKKNGWHMHKILQCEDNEECGIGYLLDDNYCIEE